MFFVGWDYQDPVLCSVISVCCFFKRGIPLSFPGKHSCGPGVALAVAVTWAAAGHCASLDTGAGGREGPRGAAGRPARVDTAGSVREESL